MLRVVVRERGATGESVLEFHKPEVTIGRVQGNDVVLPKGNVSKRHARVVVKDGKIIVVDLKSTNGTYLNGKRIMGPLVAREDDRVYIGDFTLVLASEDADEVATLEADPTESRLLAAIAQNDAGSREVYADWLEERGALERAHFLRLQDTIAAMAPDNPELRHATQRLRELAEKLDVPWRVKVARPFVEGCTGFELQCPRDWSAMAPTTRTDVRFCSGCSQNVYYCATIEEARDHALRRECVCVDAALVRFPNDLRPPRRPMLAGMMAPPTPTGGVTA